MNYSVKLFALLFFFCVDFLFAAAQQKHFIYIQSQDQQPFAVVMEGKVYSSSDYGYVIISKLSEGEYKFTVSFPLSKFPDQQFTCSIDKKDAGYFLKNNNDAWALENMQTKKVITANGASAAKASAFGDMLSDVVSDSSLTKNNTAANQPTADGVAATAVIAGAAAANKNTNAGLITDSVMQPQKIAETKLDTGTNLMFVDRTQTGVDTITAFIPFEETNNDAATDTMLSQSAGSEATDNAQNTNSVAASPTVNNDVTVPAATTPATETGAVAGATVAASGNPTSDVSNPFYKPEQSSNNNDSNNTSAINAESNQPSNQTSISNVAAGVKSGCDNMLSDDDFNKLKRKMFVQKNNSDMIQYAVKFLKNKCITTDQVKTLGYLFSSDDGRYNLYDAVYSNVYDYSNYPQLENSILDPYYKKRFAAMLR